MPNPLLLTRSAPIATITLNRPDKRNPLPYLPEHGLLPMLEQLRGEDAVRAVILTGAGKAFSSGLDLEGMKALQKSTPRENQDDAQKIGAFFEVLRGYPKPLIAALNGPAVAGGAGLALACDLIVSAPTGCLRFSEVAIGFVPAIVGVYLARSVGERTARDLLLTARNVPAEEALALGLINEVVEEDQLLERAESLARRIALNSPEAMKRTKELLAITANLSLDDALKAACDANAQARGTNDCQEGILAFLEKRKPAWQN